MAHRFISWPSRAQTQDIIRKFKENSKFPNVIGAIDGTHIRIEAPKENAADYVNRKAYHSLQLQVSKTVTVFIYIVCNTLYTKVVHTYQESSLKNRGRNDTMNCFIFYCRLYVIIEG